MSQRAQPLGTGTYWNTDWNTGKRCVQEGKHRNAMSEHGTGTGTRIRTGTGTGTKLEREILRTALVIPKFKHRTNSGDLGSRCEAMIAVLQGLMSSEVEL